MEVNIETSARSAVHPTRTTAPASINSSVNPSYNLVQPKSNRGLTDIMPLAAHLSEKLLPILPNQQKIDELIEEKEELRHKTTL